MPTSTPPAIEQAKKTIGAVLEDLEVKTGAEVKDLALEDMVDIDPQTGQPAVQKVVEITLEQKAERRWAR